MLLAMARAILTVGLALTLMQALPATAQQVAASGTDEVLLRNGQWTWIEDAAYQRIGGSDGVTILISLPGQIAYIYRDGILIAASTISTGKAGKRTPTGDFTILQKRVHHRSNLYSNAPMPFMQRLTWDGIALHAGDLPGYPASHGCIRFPREFAKRLYDITALGTAVSVVGYEIEDPRVRRGVPRLQPQQVARQEVPRSIAPLLRPDPAVFRGGEAFNIVTASNDVIIPSIPVQRLAVDTAVFPPTEATDRPASRRRR